MQFNLETDYALRCMMYLAEHQEECISSATLARTQGLHSVEHVQKVLRKLRNRELVKVKLGVSGGYYLGKLPEQITVYEVLDCMEETLCINRCLEEDAYCSRYATEYCPLHKYYNIIQAKMYIFFKDITLRDLIEEKFPDIHITVKKGTDKK
mgnify:FL=1